MATSRQEGRDQQSGSATRMQDTGDVGTTATQTAYWRSQYQHEPYYNPGEPFDLYEAAYRTGIEGRSQHTGQRFEDVEGDLRRDYENNRGASALDWGTGASAACRAAWERADRLQAEDRDRNPAGR